MNEQVNDNEDENEPAEAALFPDLAPRVDLNLHRVIFPPAVKTSYRIIALLLSLLWLPAMLHCQVEALEGQEQDSAECCEHGSDGADRTCLADNCDLFDRGHIRDTEAQWVSVEAPAVETLILFETFVAVPARELVARPEESCSPPETAKCWAFSRRLAACPRSPDLMF